MATIEVAGHRVGYEVAGEAAGDGVPLLLYHGTTMNRAAWDFVLAELPAGYTFVKVDFPGSGESSMPTAPLTVEELVGQALAVLDHVGIDRVHVAGFSLGAVVAAATAGLAPARVRSATLLCGWAVADARMRFTFDLWKRLIAADPELFMRYAIADGFTAAAIAGMEPMLEAMVPIGAGTLAPGSAAHLDLDAALDITPLLSAITAPTLVLGAEQDRWVDIAHSTALAAAIPGARMVALPAGHLVIQERAGEVAHLLHEHVSAA